MKKFTLQNRSTNMKTKRFLLEAAISIALALTFSGCGDDGGGGGDEPAFLGDEHDDTAAAASSGIKNLTEDMVSCDPGTLAYNAPMPSFTVTDGSATLVSGRDYNAAYSSNTAAGTLTLTITGKGNYAGEVVKTFAISKDPGAAVSGKPVADGVTSGSITVSPVTAPNGQDVEYAISKDGASEPSSGWKTKTTFAGLEAATAYYVFARSKENNYYSAGAAQVSDAISTLALGPCASFLEGSKRMHYGMEKDQFCDDRDGKIYVYVEIGGKFWMAENLNFATEEGSMCYQGDATCGGYGRLYNWDTAMEACPIGWHLPSENEWIDLMRDAGGTGAAAMYNKGAGKFLKAATGWDNNGEDTYGFSALPGGSANPDGTFYISAYSDFDVGKVGVWWSTGQSINSASAPGRRLNGTYHASYPNYDNASGYGGAKTFLNSVRCVKDEEQ
jgi:uncharacterized protein (TIGR02145 family)